MHITQLQADELCDDADSTREECNALREALESRIQEAMDSLVEDALWYMRLSGSKVQREEDKAWAVRRFDMACAEVHARAGQRPEKGRKYECR